MGGYERFRRFISVFGSFEGAGLLQCWNITPNAGWALWWPVWRAWLDPELARYLGSLQLGRLHTTPPVITIPGPRLGPLNICQFLSSKNIVLCNIRSYLYTNKNRHTIIYLSQNCQDEFKQFSIRLMYLTLFNLINKSLGFYCIAGRVIEPEVEAVTWPGWLWVLGVQYVKHFNCCCVATLRPGDEATRCRETGSWRLNTTLWSVNTV